MSAKSNLRIGLLACLMVVTQAAFAAPPVFKRGISMELWTSWPAETEWSKPEVLFPFPEWRRNVTPEALKALKATGLDFIRLPIDPGVFVSDQTKALRERIFTEIETAVSDLKSAGLNVIIDLHTIPGGGGNRPGAVEAVLANNGSFSNYTDIVVSFAKRFADVENIALELINEPVIDCENVTPKRWPAMVGRLHKATRDAAPNLPLVITGGCWGDAEMLKDLPKSITKDENAIFSFHSYAPFLLTHQGATWAGDFIPLVTGLPFPLDRFGESDQKSAVSGVEANIRAKAPAHRVDGMIAYLGEEVEKINNAKRMKAVLEKPFNSAAKFAKSRKISAERILLGEFGMINQEWGNPWKMPAEWRIDYLREIRKLAEAKGFGWSMWSYSGAFGVVQGFGGEVVTDPILERVIADQ